MIKKHKLVIIKLNKKAEVGDICNHMEDQYEMCMKDVDDPTYNHESVWNNRPTGVFKLSRYNIANTTYLSNAIYNKWELNSHQLILLSNDKINKGDYYFFKGKILLDNGSFPLSALCSKIIAAYPILKNIVNYEDISSMPIYEEIPTFTLEFLKSWVNNPVYEVDVEYKFVKHNQKEGHINRFNISSNNEIVCNFVYISGEPLPIKETEILNKTYNKSLINSPTKLNDIIEEYAEAYVLSHKKWSPLMRKFYVKICSEFAKSDVVKEFYQNSNKF